ncbi:MAG TPA: SRPBCC family protein [Geminicoccaceae bacterium]|nr:SRPBCC family protein [Geminicoccaceae bacterium]
MRLLSILGGGWLAWRGLRRGDPVGIGLAVLGGCLIMGAEQSRELMNRVLGPEGSSEAWKRSRVGHWVQDQADRVRSGVEGAREAMSAPIEIDERITIQRPREELYRFFRDFSNLPKIMKHVERVDVLSDRRSHWVLKAPLGTRVEWDSMVESEQENDHISWRSERDTTVPNSGTVSFKEASGGGTEVRVRLTYEAPMGRLGQMVAKLLGEEPSVQARDDLQEFKRMMESGGSGGAQPGGHTAGGDAAQRSLHH